MSIALAAAAAGSGSSAVRKNMHPPAPEPAALPPSAPPGPHGVGQALHARRAHARVERPLVLPVSVEQRADAGDVAGAQRVGHPLRHLPEPVQRGGHGAVAAVVGVHDPADGGAGEPGRAGVHEHHPALQLREHGGVEGQRLDRGVGVAELEAEEAAEGRGELVLSAAGDGGLDCLETARQIRHGARIAGLTPRRTECTDDRHVERARAAEA